METNKAWQECLDEAWKECYNEAKLLTQTAESNEDIAKVVEIYDKRHQLAAEKYAVRVLQFITPKLWTEDECKKAHQRFIEENNKT